MNVVVVLEHHFYVDENNNVWSERVVDYAYLQRYLCTFDTVIVCARMTKTNHLSHANWKLASGCGVMFYPLPEFTGAFQYLTHFVSLQNTMNHCFRDADAIIIRTPSVLSFLAFSIARKQKKPIALEMVMSAKQLFVGNNIWSRIISGIFDRKTKKMCKLANGVSYVTEQILQKEYPCSGFTANYSSIDLNPEDYYLKKIFHKPDCLKIISVGYMDDYRKGQDILILAFSMLCLSNIDATLTLVGDGKKKEEFETLCKDLNIENKVCFAGNLDKNQIKKILRESDMFVLPTKSEGLPRSILEAMSQSLPCIASNVDGIPELLEPVSLLDSFEPTSYYEKILFFVNNWQEAKRQGEINYAKSLLYSKESLSLRRKGFYDSLKEMVAKK